MARVVATPLVTILNAMQTQLLATVPNLTSSMIKFTAHQDAIPHFDGEHDVVIRLGTFFPPLGDWSARTAQMLGRYITIYPRTRYAGDPDDRDTQWILHTTLGHITWEESVMMALWGWFANDAGNSEIGNLLAYQELQVVDGGDPIKGAIDKAWGQSAVTFKVEYLFNLMAAPIV